MIFFQGRQTKGKKQKKKHSVLDKIFITYKSSHCNFEVVQNEKKSNGKRKSKSYVDGILWKKKTKIEITLDGMMVNSKNKKVISVTIPEIGFTMDVKRGNMFFQASIKLLSSQWQPTGLCDSVPSKKSDLILGEYEVFSTAEPIPGQSATFVSSNHLVIFYCLKTCLCIVIFLKID